MDVENLSSEYYREEFVKYLFILLSYLLNSEDEPKIFEVQNSQGIEDNTKNNTINDIENIRQENENEDENEKDGEDLKLLHFLIESVANDHRGLVFLVSTKKHMIFCMHVRRFPFFILIPFLLILFTLFTRHFLPPFFCTKYHVLNVIFQKKIIIFNFNFPHFLFKFDEISRTVLNGKTDSENTTSSNGVNSVRKENALNDKFLLSLINILEEDVYQAIGKNYKNILFLC